MFFSPKELTLLLLQVSAVPRAVSGAGVALAKTLGWSDDEAREVWRATLVADAAWTAPGEKPAPEVTDRLSLPFTPRKAAAAGGQQTAAPSPSQATVW